MRTLGLSVTIHSVIFLVGYWWTGDISIVGKVNPTNVHIGEDVVLSCQARNCRSPNLTVHLYKWEGSANKTVYIHRNATQPSIQGSNSREREKNRTHKGQYINGYLEVTLIKVRASDAGQYVCALTCGHEYKEDTIEVIPGGIINASVGEEVILPCPLTAEHRLFYLKMQWRRMSPRKHQTIYSYLFQNTCAVVYSEDTLGHRCTSSNGPSSRVWFGKKYRQKAEVFKGNEFRSKNGYLKLKNILEEDAGTYLCSMKSSLLHKEVTFQLSVKGIQDQDTDISMSYSSVHLYLLCLPLLELCFAKVIGKLQKLHSKLGRRKIDKGTRKPLSLPKPATDSSTADLIVTTQEPNPEDESGLQNTLDVAEVPMQSLPPAREMEFSSPWHPDELFLPPTHEMVLEVEKEKPPSPWNTQDMTPGQEVLQDVHDIESPSPLKTRSPIHTHGPEPTGPSVESQPLSTMWDLESERETEPPETVVLKHGLKGAMETKPSIRWDDVSRKLSVTQKAEPTSSSSVEAQSASSVWVVEPVRELEPTSFSGTKVLPVIKDLKDVTETVTEAQWHHTPGLPPVTQEPSAEIQPASAMWDLESERETESAVHGRMELFPPSESVETSQEMEMQTATENIQPVNGREETSPNVPDSRGDADPKQNEILDKNTQTLRSLGQWQLDKEELQKLKCKVGKLQKLHSNLEEFQKQQREVDTFKEEKCQWQLDKEELQKLQCKVGQLLIDMRWIKAWSNADNITLDADSAHPKLFIAQDKKSLTHGPKPPSLSTNPHCFDWIVSVLGNETFSSGSHYWEVEINNSTEWDLGVARRSVKRKGQISLSPKEGFWVFGRSGKDYWAKTDPWTRVIVPRKPSKIGVYLSFQEKEVTFFNVTDKSEMFVFNNCSFSEDIVPFFKNSHDKTTMRICSKNGG